MRAWYGLAAFVAVLLFGVLAAAWLLPARLDPAEVRAALEQAATERLHATVTIDGPVRFALLPRPVLQATRISVLHGSPGDADALAVTADALTARLDVRALWRGRFAAADLVLDGAQVQAPFPFDVRVLTVGRPDSLRATTITLRNARVLAGPLAAEQVDAQFVADRLTGDVALSGSFRLRGGSAWRAGLRLSRPGGDGSAALDATLDELYAADGMTARLTGQLAGDGGFAGQVVASGPNLGHLLPAPPVPFEARGRATLAGGLASIDDAALTLDHVASRLDGSVHLPPQPRVELRLAASRLDLDAWRRALQAAALPALPLRLDLTAESATLAGGVMRQLRAGLDLEGGRLTVRRAEAVLPGDMSAQANGSADLAAATSQFDLRVAGTDLAATSAWLAHLTGGRPGANLPAAMARALSGAATIGISGGEMEAHDIAATLDGVGLRGDVVVSLPSAADAAGRPSVAAILSLDRLDAAPWLAAPAAALPNLDAAIRFATPQFVWPGMPPASLDADVAWHGGALDVRHLGIASPQWMLDAAGSRSGEGRWSDAAATITADRASRVVPLWPFALPDWLTASAGWPALVAQPLRATLAASGMRAAPSATATVDLGELHMQAAGRIDPASGQWRGTLALRHPSAAGLAALAGHDAAFVGDGSLSASADLAFAAGVLSADSITLHAGVMDAGGALRLALGSAPALSGQISASLLRLPALDPHSAAPLPLDSLRGWSAAVDLDATRVDGLGADLADLHTRLTLAEGAFEASGVSAGMAGGRVSGRLGLDSRIVPPVASAELALASVRLAPPAWRPLDLASDDISGTLRLSGRGFAPAAMLATLKGEVRATAESASLIGVDAQALGDLSDATVRAALAGGVTRLQVPAMSASIDQGLATLRAEAASANGAKLGASGTVDIPDGTVDLALSITPAMADAPRIGLTISGDPHAASVAPALADLARWRASRP